MNNQTCETCKFLDGRDDDEGNGICHRYPPAHQRNVTEGRLEDCYVQPFVNYGNWCGEYSPRVPLPVVKQNLLL